MPSPQEVFEANRAILSRFKVNSNVIVHPQPANLQNKRYGHVVGFIEQLDGSLCLEIQFAKRITALGRVIEEGTMFVDPLAHKSFYVELIS